MTQTDIAMWTLTLLVKFPHLSPGKLSITSTPTTLYNCIAWAAGEDDRWWWPQAGSYWPVTAPKEETLDAFIKAFKTLGYESCTDGVLETDFEKVVIYMLNGKPTHMARQLPSGAWTSKLGREVDIQHSVPEVINGPDYGTVKQFLRRKVAK